MPSLLDEIVARKRQTVAHAKVQRPLTTLWKGIRGRGMGRDFRAAITKPDGPNLIAELKERSPIKGVLAARFEPITLARALEEAGAVALSVLTDEPYFGGKLEYLREVKQFVDVPVLSKDFLIDEYQLAESVAAEADAVLLIAAILPGDQLQTLLERSRELGLDALVEVHAEEELARAVDAGATIIGINRRNLSTFQIDLGITERLIPKIPSGKIMVVESGLESRQELVALHAQGVHAVLVGETLMTAPDPGAKVRELLGR